MVWSAVNGQDDMKGVQGILAGDTLTATIDIKDHNYDQGQYFCDLYLYDTSGNSSSKRFNRVCIGDKTAPVIEEFFVKEVTNKTFTIVAIVSDNFALYGGEFMVWSGNNGQDDMTGTWGTWTEWNGKTALQLTVSISDHKNDTGQYYCDLYLYDANKNVSSKRLSKVIVGDTVKPVISNFHLISKTNTSFTVSATVSDNVGVKNGEFMVWSDKNGQDDMKGVQGGINGDTITTTIYTKDHNNDTGIYYCHLYLYDVCGNVTSKSVEDEIVIEKLPHVYGDWETTKEATCTEAGSRKKVCKDCGDTIEEEIKALGHTWDEGKVTTPATCKEAGMMTYTCTVCGETKTETVPKLTDHTWDEGKVTMLATCKEAGVMTYTCTVCGEAKTETLPKLTDHTWDEGKVTTPATCKEVGVMTYTCTVCGEAKTETVPKLTDHTWDEGKITIKPTTSVEGVKSYTCIVCGETKTEPIPKLTPTTSESAQPQNPVLGTVTTLDSKAKALSENADPAGSAFSILQVKGKKVKKTSITLAWKAVPKAAGYVIYGAPCGTKYAKLTTTKGTSFTQTGLKKGKYYKYFVAAHDKNGNILASSKTIHVATSGGKKGNTKSVKLNKKKATLKKGKSVKLKAKLKNGKLKVSKHRKVAYETDNPKVATVSKSGKVKAVGKGKCTIYAYAQNGVFAKCKITVK